MNKYRLLDFFINDDFNWHLNYLSYDCGHFDKHLLLNNDLNWDLNDLFYDDRSLNKYLFLDDDLNGDLYNFLHSYLNDFLDNDFFLNYHFDRHL